MKFSTMAWVLGSTLVIGGMGVGAAACSSGGSGTPSSQGNDSGTTHTDSGGPTGDSGHPGDSGTMGTDTGTVDMDSGTGGDSDMGSPDCGTAPNLHPGSMGQLYCPFGPDAGAPIYCAAGTQYCCISGKVGGVYPPSDCEDISAGGCTAVMQMVQGSTQIQCEDPATDCPAATGYVCCASPAPQPVAGCGYSKITGWAYSKCEMGTACAAGETQICESQAECPSGLACVPMKAKGVQMGFCCDLDSGTCL